MGTSALSLALWSLFTEPTWYLTLLLLLFLFHILGIPYNERSTEKLEDI
jgi:hypothetical protein